MGFSFSSFVAGAAENLTETLKEDEKQAAAAASFGVKALKENYDKVQAENRTLETELSKNVKFLKENDPTATEAQLFAAATNKTYMSAVVEAAKTNPGSFRVADVVKIKEDNPSTQTALERIKAYTAIPAVAKSARQAEDVAVTDETKGLFGIGALRGRASSAAGSRAEAQTAKAMGISIEQLRAASGYKRPEIDAGAEFDYKALQEQPANVKEIKDKLDVAVIQAVQQFGENSPEYIDAKKKVDVVTAEINKLEGVADKNQEARADRLMLEKLDTKDPARLAEINRDLKATRESILNHKRLTSIKDPKEKEATYNAMKTDVSDYVNTRMRDAKGTKWRNMVDFKTYTDEATGKTITSKVTKVEMTPEQQQEMFAAERKLTAQALKENGYVLSDGTPRTPVAERLMRNFNITAADLSVEPAAPTAAPAASPAPSAQATPTTKVVSVAKVQEQAKNNNVPYEQAAAEARKQGYTIR